MKFVPERYKIKDERMKSFIDTEEIEGYLEETKNPSKEEVLAVIEKSLNKNRLNLRETAILINAESPELINLIKEGARTLKEKIYGNRIVLFALLYIGNKCKNNCL